MEKTDFWIIFLFFIVILVMFLTLYQINRFAPIIKTCEDDFNIINKCGCVPCSWRDAEKINKVPCFDVNKLNISNLHG